ncbi:hypothetical protein QUF76_07795 [Desulfobacterales bacterium HSG16]|nr:hypothetical protein [Desulfobacterales bacterium HSG16]
MKSNKKNMVSHLFQIILTISVIGTILFLPGIEISHENGCIIGPANCMAADAGTALSVTGKAFLKTVQNAAWQPLKKGGAVFNGNAIKTGAGSFVRILAPNGSMIRISGQKETVLRFSGQKTNSRAKKEDRVGGLSDFVAEFISPYSKTRINAVRSLTDPIKEEWAAFCRVRNLSTEKIDAALQLSALYYNRKEQGRAAYILWKLNYLFPENAGLKVLADKASNDHKNSGSWTLLNSGSGKPVPIVSQARIPEGNHVNIKYKGKGQNYVYLFKSVQKSGKDIQTRRLIPQVKENFFLEIPCYASKNNSGKNFSSDIQSGLMVTKADQVDVRSDKTPFSKIGNSLKKGQVVRLVKSSGRRCHIKIDDRTAGWVLCRQLKKLDLAKDTPIRDFDLSLSEKDLEGMYFIWGYIAAGPVPESLVAQSISDVEALLKQDDSTITPDNIARILPDVCGAVLSSSLSYR